MKKRNLFIMCVAAMLMSVSASAAALESAKTMTDAKPVDTKYPTTKTIRPKKPDFGLKI